MNLVHRISVTNNTVALNVPLVQSVQKRLEYIRYGRIVADSEVPLEYVAFNPLKASTTLAITDLSGEFSNNNQRSTNSVNDIYSFTGKNLNSETEKILITNQYKILDNGTVNAYFYSHTLPANTVTVTVQAVTESGSYSVDVAEYIVNTDYGNIFTTFLNTFDEVSGRYTVYYIESTDSSGNYSVAIYNPTEAFHEATFDDIDPVTGLLYQDANAYILNTLGSKYLFTLPKADTYYIKEQNETRIQLLSPTLEEADDPWLVRVTTGDFNQTIGGISYNYFIEEYDMQVFTPAMPIKFTSNENTIRVNNSLIKLQREGLYVDETSNLHLELYITDKNDGSTLYVLTTDDAKHDIEYANTGIYYDSTKIADWDTYSSIVRVDDLDIQEEWEVKAFYYYSEYAYEYTLINLNPVFNTSIENTMIVFYVVPNTKGTGERSIYHMVIRDNRILYTSQTGGTVVPNLSQFLEDGTPNPDSIVGSNYKPSALYESTFTDSYPQYLVLAEVNILEASRISDAIRIDIRQSGGMIKKDKVDDAILSSARIAYLPGIAPLGGYPYPQYATHVIKIPYELLLEYGGTLTKDVIRQKVEKHLAAGEYAVIHFDGVIPNIFEVIPGTCNTIKWYQEDPSYTFKVYRSANIDSGFVEIAHVNGSTYESNQYLDCDVISGRIYYYYITAISATNIESPRSVVWGVKTI